MKRWILGCIGTLMALALSSIAQEPIQPSSETSTQEITEASLPQNISAEELSSAEQPKDQEGDEAQKEDSDKDVASIEIQPCDIDIKLLLVKYWHIGLTVLILLIIGSVIYKVIRTRKMYYASPAGKEKQETTHPRCPCCGWRVAEGETQCRNCHTRF